MRAWWSPLLVPLNIDVDPSADRRGWVYVLASVTTQTPEPLAVHFARSVDGGVTWSDFIRVNDDDVSNTSYHWFGTMSISPSGRLDAVWLDTRDDPFNGRSALFYSFSIDGGTTWSANLQLSVDFDHRKDVFCHIDIKLRNAVHGVACSAHKRAL